MPKFDAPSMARLLLYFPLCSFFNHNKNSMEKPLHQRPEHAEFWDSRFQSGCTPWQDGGVHAELPRFLPALPAYLGRSETPANAPLQGLRVLIPGCGHAFEATYLSTLGAHVVALDFSAAALARAREVLADWEGELVQGDFFTYAPTEGFDIIFERAFLCALPRRLWPDYARQTARLIRPGGILAGFFFYGEEGKGPPFAATPKTLMQLLEPHFTLIDDQAVAKPLPLFPGERWQVWQICPPDAHALA
jgi:thiopurine S-methyltransferase